MIRSIIKSMAKGMVGALALAALITVVGCCRHHCGRLSQRTNAAAEGRSAEHMVQATASGSRPAAVTATASKKWTPIVSFRRSAQVGNAPRAKTPKLAEPSSKNANVIENVDTAEPPTPSTASTGIPEPRVHAHPIPQKLPAQANATVDPQVTLNPAFGTTPGALLASRANSNAARPIARPAPTNDVQATPIAPLDTVEPATVIRQIPAVHQTDLATDVAYCDREITLRAVAVVPYQDTQFAPGFPQTVPPARVAGKVLGPGEIARSIPIGNLADSGPKNGNRFSPAPTSQIVTVPLPEDARSLTLHGVAVARQEGVSDNGSMHVAELPPRSEIGNSTPGAAENRPITFSPLPRPTPSHDAATSDQKK